MKKFIIILIVMIAGFSASSQSVWKVNWDMNAPIGETADFSGKFSVRGASVDASWFLNNNVALGGTLAWGLFYEQTGKITEEFSNGTGAITGKQKKYNNFVPMLFNGEYYFGDAGKARPYLGLGLGASWRQLIKDIGLYEYYQPDWMFTLAPEAGVIIPISGTFNAHVKAKYLHGFQKDQNLQTFTISVGFAFTSYRY